MIILAKLVGLVIVMIGTVVALNPNTFKTIMNFWRQGKNIYLAGAFRLIFGIIFLLAAPGCRLAAVISVLGVLMIMGGIVIFVMGQQSIHKIFDWWEKKPPAIIRLMGIAALAIGSLVLYSI